MAAATKTEPAKKRKACAAKMGRPCKLTKEIQNKIVTAIGAGAFVETAATYANVSKPTLYDWLRRGNEQKEGKYRDFLNAIEGAFATATVADLALISAAANKDWRAAAYRLEKRERRLYGPHVEISGPDGGPIPVKQSVDLTGLSREELEKFEKLLLKAGYGGPSSGHPGTGEAGDSEER